MRTKSLFLLLGLFLVGACSSTTSSVPKGSSDAGVDPDASEVDAAAEPADAAATHIVSVTNFAYTPADLKIKVGDTVEWVWEEGTHTVSSGADCVANKKIESGRHTAPFTFRHTFTEAGTVSYLCDYMQHCAKGQSGTVVVTAR